LRKIKERSKVPASARRKLRDALALNPRP
jgi:hypothetical protein